MVLDLILFRADQGGDPDKIREAQRKRYKDVSHVEKVIEADTKWRKRKRWVSENRETLNARAHAGSSSP